MTNNTTSSQWEFLSTGYSDLDLYLHTFFGIYHPQLIFAQLWLYMEQHYSEFAICVWGSLLVQTAGYVITSIPAFLFQFIPFLQKYKIQQNRPLTLKEQMKCINMVVFSHTCIFVPLMMFLYYATRPFNIPYDYASMPRWYTFFPICFFCLVVEDTWHYWLHRGLHHPKLYGPIHKLHHTFASPFPWAAEYAHPIETMVLGAGFFAPLPFVCTHLSIFYMWLFVRSMQSTDAHAGYSIYWNPLNLLPFYGGAEFHDYHHRAFTGNYASSFRWWDWYCGTDVEYNKFQAQKLKQEGERVNKKE